MNADAMMKTNLYCYCSNNPVIYYDPNGHDERFTCPECDNFAKLGIYDNDHSYYYLTKDFDWYYNTDDYPIKMRNLGIKDSFIVTLNSKVSWKIKKGDEIHMRITNNTNNPVEALLVIGEHYAAPIEFNNKWTINCDDKGIIVSVDDGPKGRVNIRKKPSTYADSIAQLYRGTEVSYIGDFIKNSGEKWYLVSGEFGTGFVRSDFCTTMWGR